MLLLALLYACHSPEKSTIPVECADLLHGCTMADKLTLQFSSPPSALTAFDLVVKAGASRDIHATFKMKGMQMGENRYRLVFENGVWKAKVLLPVCVQGRRDWLLLLDVDGQQYVVPFVSGSSL